MQLHVFFVNFHIVSNCETDISQFGWLKWGGKKIHSDAISSWTYFCSEIVYTTCHQSVNSGFFCFSQKKLFNSNKLYSTIDQSYTLIWMCLCTYSICLSPLVSTDCGLKLIVSFSTWSELTVLNLYWATIGSDPIEILTVWRLIDDITYITYIVIFEVLLFNQTMLKTIRIKVTYKNDLLIIIVLVLFVLSCIFYQICFFFSSQ